MEEGVTAMTTRYHYRRVFCSDKTLSELIKLAPLGTEVTPSQYFQGDFVIACKRVNDTVRMRKAIDTYVKEYDVGSLPNQPRVDPGV